MAFVFGLKMRDSEILSISHLSLISHVLSRTWYIEYYEFSTIFYCYCLSSCKITDQYLKKQRSKKSDQNVEENQSYETFYRDL